MLIRNSIDYMNGNAELCTMRTKGLSFNYLSVTNPALAGLAKLFNQFGLAVIVTVIGLLVWKKRSKRRAAIHNHYNPNDTRTISE